MKSRSTLVPRNVSVAGRRTSFRLEKPFWRALEDVARRRGLSVHELLSEIEAARTESALTAAVRVYLLQYFWEATDRLLEDPAPPVEAES